MFFAGALPVLVDITPDTCYLDPDLAEAAILERTQAIIVVHLGDQPADLDRFKALEAEGVPTQAIYPPLHDLDFFKSGAYRKRLCPSPRDQEHVFLLVDFSNMLTAAWETVGLVHRVLLASEDEIVKVVEAIKKIQRHAAALA